MDIVKRLLPCIQISKRKTSKLRNKSKVSFENLSNEIFYEICDYLDGIDIYNAFSNLNHAFQQLLNSSFLLFKIKLYSYPDELNMNAYKQILLNHKHQIFYMNVWPPSPDHNYLSSFTYDSSLIRLESLVFEYSELESLSPLLINLASLPRLFSLRISVTKISEDLNDIYRLIFALPSLKSNKLSICMDKTHAFPAAINQQSNTIKYLVINHSCTFSELLTIISNTPQVCRLECLQTSMGNSTDSTISPVVLSNLTDIFIRVHRGTFNELEIFISKIHAKLKVLHFDLLSHDIAYLDAYRWEQFILKNFPQLEKFYLEYYEYSDKEQGYSMYSGRPNQFCSSFWIERQWICETVIDYGSITYLVHPYKKRWYEYDIQHKVVYSSNELSKSNQLTFVSHSDTEYLRSTPVTIDIKHVLSVFPIYHLQLIEEKTVVGQLIEVMDVLREIKTLKISCLSIYYERDVWEEKYDLLSSLKNTSKITKVCLVNIDMTEEFDFLMELCPYMEYFKVECINSMNVEYLLQHVLNKINNERNQHLRLLCFNAPAADEEMIKKLNKMIHTEKLLGDYRIQRVGDDIYLQWK